MATIHQVHVYAFVESNETLATCKPQWTEFNSVLHVIHVYKYKPQQKQTATCERLEISEE